MARIYSKKWAYWKAEVIEYNLDKYKERFHDRHLFDVIDIDSKKIYRRMRIAFHCGIKKKNLPQVGDIVLLKYCKHKDDIDDNIQESRIVEIVNNE